jgi:hypothetical protein
MHIVRDTPSLQSILTKTETATSSEMSTRRRSSLLFRLCTSHSVRPSDATSIANDMVSSRARALQRPRFEESGTGPGPGSFLNVGGPDRSTLSATAHRSGMVNPDSIQFRKVGISCPVRASSLAWIFSVESEFGVALVA